MNKKQLKSLMKKFPWLKAHISFGMASEKICLVHNIFKRQYQVFIPERAQQLKYKSFSDKDKAVEYLWDIFGGNDRLTRLKEENILY